MYHVVALDADTPPPFRIGGLLTQAVFDPVLGTFLLLAAGLYLLGVYRLHVRGDRWPLSRTLLFLVPGLGSIAVATLSGLAAYDDSLLSVHMVQHMVLSMIAPIFLALGAPITLALRTLPIKPRRLLVAAVHSRVAKVLSMPLVAYALFVANPFVLYFTGLYRLTLENAWVHEWVHLHFLVTGCLFFWPLLGLDPLPNRWPYPARALLMLLSTPFHVVLGLTIMQSTSLIGGDWYPSLGLAWANPHTDQVLGGGILWAGGEVVSVTMLAALVVQWMRQSDREARREDRRLDLAEAANRAASRAAKGARATMPAASQVAGRSGAAADVVAAGEDDGVWQAPWWETKGTGATGTIGGQRRVGA